MRQLPSMREGPPTTFADKVFEAQINQFIQQCDADYERYLLFIFMTPSALSPVVSMNYRNVVVSWHSYKDAKDTYVLVSESQGQTLNRDLILRYIRVLVLH